MFTQETKEKLGINQQNCSQTSGRGSLLNLTKVLIVIKGNGSMKTNMEKGGIIMNFTILRFDIDLIRTNESSGGESEVESHNDSAQHEII